MSTIAGNDSATTAWRPTPWIAATLGFVGGVAGLLYVHRPWLAGAYLCGSMGLLLAVFYAIWGLDVYLDLELVSWGSWVVAIVLAIHSYSIASAAPALAQRRWYSRWYGLIAIPLTLFVLVFLFRSFFYESYNIPGESMYPTLPRGSLVFVSKAGLGRYGTYGITIWRSGPTAPIARGDLVAYRWGSDPAMTYLHRVVGLPGERIEYTNRRLTINGNTMPVRLGARDGIYQLATERLDGREATLAFIEDRHSRDWAGTVPPQHYLVFGDSRDNARDSRFAEVGFVPRDHIVGRVAKIVKQSDPR